MKILAVSIIVIIGLAVLFVNLNLTASGASTNATNYHKTMRAQ